MSDTSTTTSIKPKRVLAIASGGGHWIQLLRLMPVFDQHDTAFATVNRNYQHHVPGRRLYAVRDANRWDKVGLLIQLFQVFLLLLRYRPQVIITTGASTGFFALRLGKLFGARTVWLDSIANSETLSDSGARIGKYADLWLTQWEHLADKNGPVYGGQVL